MRGDPQVVYFHHPRFCRQPQLPLHRIPDSPMHMLPLIMQLLPEIPLFYDDDAYVPGLTPLLLAPGGDDGKKKGGEWIWLAACGSFFLVDVRQNSILSANEQGLASLVAHYLRCTGNTVQAVEVDPAAALQFSANVASAPSAHVELRV